MILGESWTTSGVALGVAQQPVRRGVERVGTESVCHGVKGSTCPRHDGSRRRDRDSRSYCIFGRPPFVMRHDTSSASLTMRGPVGIRWTVHHLPLHPHRRRSAAVEVERVDEPEAPGQRAQLDERHPDAELRLAPVDGDEPDRVVRRCSDHRSRVTVLGKSRVEALDAPVLDVAAVSDEEAGAAHDVLRKQPGFRLTFDRIVRHIEPHSSAPAKKAQRLGNRLAAER